MKGVGRKKGVLKVHMLADIHADSAEFVKISEAKSHDKNFLQHLVFPEGSMIVFDKAYNHYLQFAQWTQESVNFVCRLKDNAVYEVQDVLFEQELPEKQSGVLKRLSKSSKAFSTIAALVRIHFISHSCLY
jgi:hypothetical protein